MSARRLRRWGAVTAAALIVVAAVWAVWYRDTYHLWPGQSVPPRVHWCGRDYDRSSSPPVAYAEARRTLGAPLRHVMRVPPAGRRHDVVAAIGPGAAERRERGGVACASLIALRLGPSRYLFYELQGGV
ncbi:hypothetical protein [Miltoncostaea marina]|uniref:hypothetical protein n=1 Tax=Miltoncostaea marina TaxID=2843215 RepID=UPI001C3DEA3C|nr:hypothetical protein [Miltoncostaea marina]